MTNGWYIERQGTVGGPFTGAQLKELAASGRLRPDDRVRRGHDGKAALAGKVQGLFAPDAVQRPSVPSGSISSSPQHHGSLAHEPPPLPGSPTPPSSSPNRSFSFGHLYQRAANAAFALKGATVDASRLAVLEAERAKLRAFSLPRTYAALGAFVLAERPQSAADFPELVKRIREREELLAKLSQSERVEEEAQGLSGRARGVVAKLTNAASQKVHASQQKNDLAELGRLAFDRYGEDAGPAELITPVREVRRQVNEIEEELQSLDRQAEGRILTPRRMAMVGAAFCVMLLVGVLSRSSGIGASAEVASPASGSYLERGRSRADSGIGERVASPASGSYLERAIDSVGRSEFRDVQYLECEAQSRVDALQAILVLAANFSGEKATPEARTSFLTNRIRQLSHGMDVFKQVGWMGFGLVVVPGEWQAVFGKAPDIRQRTEWIGGMSKPSSFCSWRLQCSDGLLTFTGNGILRTSPPRLHFTKVYDGHH